MTAPVDLTNLRSMTDGDRELEKSLFEEFYNSFEAGVKEMRVLCAPGSEEAWRKQAHALKGIALNLGAAALGDLCKKAQDEHTAVSNEKALMVEAISGEYDKVKEFLHTLD